MVSRKPTIYEALATKLGRTPTASELKADFQRILRDGLVEMAGKGEMLHQKGAI
jgi:hypothetical protein